LLEAGGQAEFRLKKSSEDGGGHPSPIVSGNPSS
jgi:hypothetical protein